MVINCNVAMELIYKASNVVCLERECPPRGDSPRAALFIGVALVVIVVEVVFFAAGLGAEF